MNMATGRILSYSMNHKPDLKIVMKSPNQVLPIFKQAKYRTILHSDQDCQSISRKGKLFRSFTDGKLLWNP